MSQEQSNIRRTAIELPADLARNRLLDSGQAAALCGYSLAHWRRLYRTNKVPPPVKINGRKTGWPAGLLLDFLAKKAGTAREAA